MEATWQQGDRGRLKVFLAYASGVGKSFRMFDEGRRRRERGQDVVVGAVQPKIPHSLEPLLHSLEQIPMLEVSGTAVMDVDAVLKRHPQVCLVDGLAYDNPKPCRNAHRWQDVEELLRAGITVVGSVNLQHIDDQREAAEKITGKLVDQTIPRAFLNTADEIVIVDTPSETTTKGLSTLREMALLLSADVIDSGLQNYLKAHGIEAVRGTRERLMVCLTPKANAERMLASAHRNAERFHCDLLAVYVKQPSLTPEDQRYLQDHLQRAAQEGAIVAVLDGDDPIETIVNYARSHGITQIFVGHSLNRDWRSRLFGSPVNKLVRAATGIDVRIFPH